MCRGRNTFIISTNKIDLLRIHEVYCPGRDVVKKMIRECKSKMTETKDISMPTIYEFQAGKAIPMNFWPFEDNEESFQKGFSRIFSRVDDKKFPFNLEIFEQIKEDVPHQFYACIDAGNTIYNFFLPTLIDLNDFLRYFEPLLALK